MAARILVVEDELPVAKTLERQLHRRGYRVTTATNLAEARRNIEAARPDLALLDLGLRHEDGLSLLIELHKRGDSLPVIVITANDDPAIHAEVLGRFNAHDFVAKPYDANVLDIRIKRALRHHPADPWPQIGSQTLASLRPGTDPIDAVDLARSQIIGDSRATEQLVRQVVKMGPSNMPVLVTGATGTGKEVVTRALHLLSARQKLITVNGPNMSEYLLESELFGHVRGAFTGADSDRTGLFEEAHLGTLFIDELGDLPLSTQAKLLRVLDTGEVRRIGSNSMNCYNVRIIGATNKNLEHEIGHGRFRSDLRARFGWGVLEIQPLRERPDDIVPLIRFFQPDLSLSSDSLDLLQKYRWPYNVRELRMALEYARTMASGSCVEPSHLPEEIRCSTPTALSFASHPTADGIGEVPGLGSGGLNRRRARYCAPDPIEERTMIVAAMKDNGGRRRDAAKQCGMSKTVLYERVARYGISEDEWKASLNLPP